MVKQITFTVHPDLAEILEKAAARSGRSLNQFMRTAIEQWTREHGLRGPTNPPPPRSRMGGWL
jgi:hypothetical protein